MRLRPDAASPARGRVVVLGYVSGVEGPRGVVRGRRVLPFPSLDEGLQRTRAWLDGGQARRCSRRPFGPCPTRVAGDAAVLIRSDG